MGEDFNASIGEHHSVMGSHEGDIVDGRVKTDYGIAAISGSRRVHPNAFRANDRNDSIPDLHAVNAMANACDSRFGKIDLILAVR